VVITSLAYLISLANDHGSKAPARQGRPATAYPDVVARTAEPPPEDVAATDVAAAAAPGIGPPAAIPPATGLPDPKPLDPPMVPFAVAGTVAWVVAALVLLPWRQTHGSWLWICLAGVLWGFVGVAVLLRRDANRRRRRT
jgi:uncharacterized protein DUF2530